MSSIISELILTIFSPVLELYIYCKKALKPEHLSLRHAGFYTYIFTPLLVMTALVFTALILTMCLAIKSQKDEARRMQASSDSLIHNHSEDMEMDEPVNDHYTTQPSSSFVELQPSAPGETMVDQDMVFGQYLTVDIMPA